MNKNNQPYLSGDSFAALADYYVYGQKGIDNLDLIKLKQSQTLFVNSELLNRLINEISGIPIKTRVIITGNSDFNFTKPVALPESIKLWLCQNNAMSKSNLIRTLPIGIENLRLGRLGQPKWYKPFNFNASINKVLVPPMSPTNIQRHAARAFGLQNPQLFDVYTEYLSEDEYFELTRCYRFILCCEGNGYENHRIWETLYQGSFPILINSKWAQSLKYLNLPILIVNSLADLTQNKLERFLYSNNNFDPNLKPELWIPFWKDLITSQY